LCVRMYAWIDVCVSVRPCVRVSESCVSLCLSVALSVCVCVHVCVYECVCVCLQEASEALDAAERGEQNVANQFEDEAARQVYIRMHITHTYLHVCIHIHTCVDMDIYTYKN